jgi:7-carboxy-7-deazaguanine synthase
MHRLLADPVGYTLMIETSGERPLAGVPAAVHKIVDVKCPSSNEAGTFHLPNLDALTARDELKFVIANREDYEYARDFIGQHVPEKRAGQILLSPAFTKTPSAERTTANMTLDPRELVDWMLADGLPARLSLQIHKFIWEPMKKGV